MISVSIVVYKHNYEDIIVLLNSFNNNLINFIYIVDNSPTDEFQNRLHNIYATVVYIFGQGNIGFGAGHNLAIKKSIKKGIKYHLVLNPDIHFESKILNRLLDYMEANKNVGLIMPKIENEDRSTQLLPKLLPSPLDMIIRIFPPFKKIYKKQYELYVLTDHQDDELNVPIISGCFSLFRIETLRAVGIYDEKFFMYFEDFDLSRRIHTLYKTIYYPDVSVIHTHERGATKSFRLFKIFISSAIIYFNKYGWFFDKKRKLINKKVIDQLK